jgi:methionyl-tRNA formyltransferase
MNAVILTQNDPFFLAENLDYLFGKMPKDINISGCVVFQASPFGKKQGFIDKIIKTWEIFGTGFLMNYGLRFIKNKFRKGKKVKYILKKHGIPLILLNEGINAQSSLEKIKTYNPDVLVSIAGNQIFKEKLINLAPNGCLNLHTALLPKYRGLMPSFWVMKNDETQTGVSVFFVDENIDSGPILVQEELHIGNLTHQQLIKKTKKMGMDAIIVALKRLKKGGYKLLVNSDQHSTYFSFPTAEDVKKFKDQGKIFY